MSYKKLGIPYLGSKRRIAEKLVDYMLKENPNAKYVYDLFGGGGAMSFEFLQRPQIEKVFYNELNTGVVELLKKIKNDGVTEEFYRWISRDDFHRLKKENSWIGGLVSTCWSFGNNQRTYLFGKQNELLKKPLHELIVDKNYDMINKFYDLTGILIPIECISAATINERRIEVMRYVKNNNKAGLQLQQLQQLERLERLQRLQQLEQLQRLEITNLDYMDVAIITPIDETLVYLDPPYKDTEKYQHDTDHAALYDWVNGCPYTVYMSGYDAPYDVVYTIDHRCTFSQNRNTKTKENLYCNNKLKII